MKTLNAIFLTILLAIVAAANGGHIGTDKQSGQTVPVTNNEPLRSGKGSCY